ncbi:hypothetical protein BCR34DRAFT_605777 [Clohesyomyces aquaticus]|uniref:Uncharacterized protein n=1 Tax=Clohesyomyces aquaticus TaxID=1231657 RepID=A0A1Y1YUV6_9PLEO|nr:hypothetical protein BCR34DRAFT_605777 [Clohesyomyces aquaticus]
MATPGRRKVGARGSIETLKNGLKQNWRRLGTLPIIPGQVIIAASTEPDRTSAGELVTQYSLTESVRPASMTLLPNSTSIAESRRFLDSPLARKPCIIRDLRRSLSFSGRRSASAATPTFQLEHAGHVARARRGFGAERPAVAVVQRPISAVEINKAVSAILRLPPIKRIVLIQRFAYDTVYGEIADKSAHVLWELHMHFKIKLSAPDDAECWSLRERKVFRRHALISELLKQLRDADTTNPDAKPALHIAMILRQQLFPKDQRPRLPADEFSEHVHRWKEEDRLTDNEVRQILLLQPEYDGDPPNEVEEAFFDGATAPDFHDYLRRRPKFKLDDEGQRVADEETLLECMRTLGITQADLEESMEVINRTNAHADELVISHEEYMAEDRNNEESADSFAVQPLCIVKRRQPKADAHFLESIEEEDEPGSLENSPSATSFLTSSNADSSPTFPRWSSVSLNSGTSATSYDAISRGDVDATDKPEDDDAYDAVGASPTLDEMLEYVGSLKTVREMEADAAKAMFTPSMVNRG